MSSSSSSLFGWFSFLLLIFMLLYLLVSFAHTPHHRRHDVSHSHSISVFRTDAHRTERRRQRTECERKETHNEIIFIIFLLVYCLISIDIFNCNAIIWILTVFTLRLGAVLRRLQGKEEFDFYIIFPNFESQVSFKCWKHANYSGFLLLETIVHKVDTVDRKRTFRNRASIDLYCVETKSNTKYPFCKCRHNKQMRLFWMCNKAIQSVCALMTKWVWRFSDTCLIA